MSLNVFGERLIECSQSPITGYFRDGCCNTDDTDLGEHTVCAIMSDEFLQFSYMKGNDLITPRPNYQFSGLQDGDRWCLCASRWLEALKAGVAPKIVLEATHEKMLNYVSLEELIKYAFIK